MAYIFDPEKDKTQQQPMGAGAPPPTTVGTGGAATQGTSGAAKPTGSGQFTNLQSYIRANENTDAGQKVGQGVLASADPAVKTAQSEVGKLTSMTPGAGPATMDKADEDFLTGLGAPAPAPSQNRPGSVDTPPPGTGPFGNTGGFGGSVAQQAAAEQAAQKSQADKERYDQIFKKYSAGPGTYSGPSVQDVSTQEASAINAQNQAGKAANVLQSGNTAGRSDLLRTQYGNNQAYSGGENKLDSFLLERGFGGQFDPKFQQIKGQLTSQEEAGKAAAGKLKGDIETTQKAFTDTSEKWRKLLADAGTAVGSKEYNAEMLKQTSDATQAREAQDAQIAAQDDAARKEALQQQAQDAINQRAGDTNAAQSGAAQIVTDGATGVQTLTPEQEAARKKQLEDLLAALGTAQA